MRISVSSRDLSELKADLAVCFAYEDDRKPRAVADRGLSRELAAQMKAEKFKGRSGDLLIWNTDGRYGTKRYLVVGLGSPARGPGEAIRLGCAQASREAVRWNSKKSGARTRSIYALLKRVSAIHRDSSSCLSFSISCFENFISNEAMPCRCPTPGKSRNRRYRGRSAHPGQGKALRPGSRRPQHATRPLT